MAFKKGQSGNPGGRPKLQWTLTQLYIEELEKTVVAKTGDEMQGKQAVAKAIVSLAINGDINAIKELGNRIEGMPKQATDLTSQGDKINGPIYYPVSGESEK